jgi:hypothetical protein
MSMLDDYAVEIDETDHRRVVLIVPDLRLIVLGQTLTEACALANAAITFGGARNEPAGTPTRAAESDRDAESPPPDRDTAQAA